MRDLRMPPIELIQLGQAHDDYRNLVRNHMPIDWFAYEVGSRLCPLPEKGVGNPLHLPVCQLNTLNGAGFGWAVTDFMLVLPAVGKDDIVFGGCLSDDIGNWLKGELLHLGFDVDNTRATHALRFPKPTAKAYGSSHKRDNGAFVRADCYACNPRAIITFGADALKALFGQDAKLDSFRGAVYDWQGIPVIPTVSPYVFVRSHGGLDVFQGELWRAMEVTMKQYVPGADLNGALPDGDWRELTNADEVEAFEAFLAAGNYTQLAIDTEFGNDTGREEDGYLLSFQIAWGPNTGAFIQLRGGSTLVVDEGTNLSHYQPGGQICHSQEQLERIHASIVRMMKRPGVQLLGQHLRTDVEMPHREGMDFDDQLEDGFDNMLAYHLLHGGSGDEGLGLDHQTRKYASNYGAYWKPVEDWIDSDPTFMVFELDKAGGQRVWRPRTRSRKQVLQHGYRDVPYEILIPYALKDVSVTWIAAQSIKQDLAAQPQLEKLFKEVVMPASLHIMDVQRYGIRQDRERIKQLRERYQPEYDSMLQEFRDLVQWPDFNPGSADQKKYFLHSTTEYRGRDEFVAKNKVPASAKVLTLTPLITTGKYPKDWAQVVGAAEQHLYSPSTKAATIDLLFNEHKDIPELKLLKNLSVLGKFLSTYLYEAPLNEFGVLEAGKNVANCMWKDGRVRGNLHQTSETGRWRMSGANLQCNPKKQEDAAIAIFVERRFGGMTLSDYKFRTDDRPSSKCPPELKIAPEDRIILPTVKSAFIPEEGWTFIEVDFKTAELAVWGYCSGDQVLVDIIEQDRDMHCETATEAFGLPKEEMEAAIAELNATGKIKRYKAWVDWVKKLHNEKRDAAKVVGFGIAYGKSAFSLARDISKTGRVVTVEECEQIIQGIARKFPKAWAWLENNSLSAIQNEFVQTAFGRKRYFPGIQQMSEKDQKAAQREAKNSPIQGCLSGHTLVNVDGTTCRFDDLKDQQVVTLPNGLKATVVASGVKDTVCVRFAGGRSVDLTPDHRVLTLTPKGQVWVAAAKLTKKSVVVLDEPELPLEPVWLDAVIDYRGSNAKHNRTLSVPLDEDLAWMLGHCVGDGSMTAGAHNYVAFLFQLDQEVMQQRVITWLTKHSISFQISDHFERSPGVPRGVTLRKIYVGHGILRKLFVAAGLAIGTHMNVRVPSKIFASPASVRWAFLNGYWCADGAVPEHPHASNMSWCSASRQLVVDVGNLLASMGVYSTWFKDGAGYHRGTMNGGGMDEFLKHGGISHPEKQRRLVNAVSRRTKCVESGAQLPVWLAQQCIPAALPPGSSPAHYTIYRRVLRVASSISCWQLKRMNVGSAAYVVPKVAVVSLVDSAPAQMTFDLVVKTKNEGERRFVSNGIVVHNCVADLLAVAGVNLYRMRFKTEIGKRIGWRVLLPIHDAFLVEVRDEHVQEMKQVLRYCMSIANKIPGTDKSLGIKVEVFNERWGEEEHY